MPTQKITIDAVSRDPNVPTSRHLPCAAPPVCPRAPASSGILAVCYDEDKVESLGSLLQADILDALTMAHVVGTARLGDEILRQTCFFLCVVENLVKSARGMLPRETFSKRLLFRMRGRARKSRVSQVRELCYYANVAEKDLLFVEKLVKTEKSVLPRQTLLKRLLS